MRGAMLVQRSLPSERRPQSAHRQRVCLWAPASAGRSSARCPSTRECPAAPGPTALLSVLVQGVQLIQKYCHQCERDAGATVSLMHVRTQVCNEAHLPGDADSLPAAVGNPDCGGANSRQQVWSAGTPPCGSALHPNRGASLAASCDTPNTSANTAPSVLAM